MFIRDIRKDDPNTPKDGMASGSGDETDADCAQAQFGTQFEGHHGLQPWTQLPKYDRTYQSKYGPK